MWCWHQGLGRRGSKKGRTRPGGSRASLLRLRARHAGQPIHGGAVGLIVHPDHAGRAVPSYKGLRPIALSSCRHFRCGAGKVRVKGSRTQSAQASCSIKALCHHNNRAGPAFASVGVDRARTPCGREHRPTGAGLKIAPVPLKLSTRSAQRSAKATSPTSHDVHPAVSRKRGVKAAIFATSSACRCTPILVIAAES